MEEYFEAMYEDELAVLDELEEPGYDIPKSKSKRSLAFQTPVNQKSKEICQTDLNGSISLTPCDSPPENERKSSKRTQQELFGDLSDIEDTPIPEDDLPDIAPMRKRPRMTTTKSHDDFDVSPPPSPTKDDLIMQRIVEERNRRDVPALRVSNSIDTYRDRITKDYDLERRRVLKRIPQTNFMATTSEQGQRVYMALKSDTKLQQQHAIKSSSCHGGLLSVPYSVLKARVDQERLQKVMKESTRITDTLHRKKGYTEEGDIESDNDSDTEVAIEVKPRQHLWVEKYKPIIYTDLLSEESINRNILHWLRLWDHTVFGKPKLTKNKTKDQKNDQKKFKKPEFDEYDQYGRPYHKVTLLCGPPGLGKTTLAHVVAQHAGYNVVEINASDDRSAEIFKTKIEAATQMKSVLAHDQRPNCLIIDEIDGAPQPAINSLLNTIKQTDKAGGKKRKKGGLLMRPIICICNDQYVPSLRQLRQNAMVVLFPQTLAARLAQRLLEVSRLERLKTDLSTLLCLCEKTDNDIRSCLNTLQFINKAKQELTMVAVQSMNIGQKDAHKSLFEVWRGIFQMPRARRRKFVNPHDRNELTDFSESGAGVSNTSLQSRFYSSLDIAMAAGEHDKVKQGLFENYLEVRIKDPNMDAVNLANDWLCFSDLVSQQIAHSQDYITMRYQSYLIVTFHLLFASNTIPKLTYPNSQYECFTKLTRSTNLVQMMMNEMLPSVRSYLNQATTVMDVLPPLLEIMQPNLRPLNTQLYSSREKEDLALLIKIMIAYNMTYHQERLDDGQYNYVLDPNVDAVVYFPGMKQHKTLTYAAKQIVSREIEIEKMKRNERHEPTALNKVSQKQTTNKRPSSPVVPNHLQRLDAKAVKLVEEKPARDFFGRVIQKKILSSTEPFAKKEKKNILCGDIWFRFKEGFSNAVRKPVKILDLL